MVQFKLARARHSMTSNANGLRSSWNSKTSLRGPSRLYASSELGSNSSIPPAGQSKQAAAQSRKQPKMTLFKAFSFSGAPVSAAHDLQKLKFRFFINLRLRKTSLLRTAKCASQVEPVVTGADAEGLYLVTCSQRNLTNLLCKLNWTSGIYKITAQNYSLRSCTASSSTNRSVLLRVHSSLVTVGIFASTTSKSLPVELVNARLAMIGFVWGGIQEFKTGATMLSQAQNMSLPAIIVCLLFVYASMVPVMHSARMEPFGIFTPRAELTNGRAAMVGFLCILALEYKAGVPFF